MQRITLPDREGARVPNGTRLTLTYAALVLVLLLLNVAGYGLIAATI
jgi:hypothetical protein